EGCQADPLGARLAGERVGNRRVLAAVRVAHVVGAGLAVLGTLGSLGERRAREAARGVGVGRSGCARRARTLARRQAAAVDGDVQTAARGAGVVGAAEAVVRARVAVGQRGVHAGPRLAPVGRAGVLIVAAAGLEPARPRCVAVVDGARVAVVAVHRLEDADAEPAAGVHGARIAVVTAYEPAGEGLRLCRPA